MLGMLAFLSLHDCPAVNGVCRCSSTGGTRRASSALAMLVMLALLMPDLHSNTGACPWESSSARTRAHVFVCVCVCA